MKVWKLTERLRKEFKKPLGQLIVPDDISAVKKVEVILGNEKISLMVAIGDVCTKSLLSEQIVPDMIIIDGKTLRTELVSIDSSLYEKKNIKNPPGYITESSWKIIDQMISEILKEKKRKLLFVEGEEDLLLIPVVMELPIGSVVLYGQPPVEGYSEGIVLVRITPEIKEEVEKYLNLFEIVDN